MDFTTLVIALFLAGESLLAIVASLYVAVVLNPERGKEAFLDRLINRDIRIAIAAAPIAFVVSYSLARFAIPELALGPLVPPFGALLIGIPLAVLLLGPIDDALTVWKERRAK